MEDKIESLGNGRVIIHQDFDKLETELHEARARLLDFRERKWGMTTRMAPKRTSSSAAPTMTQAAIKKLVANSVATALEA
ncbi:hypothetical protein Tco_0559492 [Tanacetum coccineum]